MFGGEGGLSAVVSGNLFEAVLDVAVLSYNDQKGIWCGRLVGEGLDVGIEAKQRADWSVGSKTEKRGAWR